MNFKNHPDAIYIYACSLNRRGEHGKAFALMEIAFTMYERNGCILNRTSEFLNTFCDMCVNSQPEIEKFDGLV